MSESIEMSVKRSFMNGSGNRPDPGRRKTLRLLGATAAGTAAGALFGISCATDGDPAPTEVPLEDLPLGERVRVLHGETPVELLRSAEGVTARSLWCTHYGCEVVWDGPRGVYLCPCHDGVFDARGRVKAGPPTAPLRRVEVRVEGDRVIIDPDEA